MAHAILASLVIKRRNAHVLDKPSAKQGRRSYCQCAGNSGQVQAGEVIARHGAVPAMLILWGLCGYPDGPL
ncbi:hypothetical protein BOH73_18785 [Pseudomonas versuta]|uniref:Uncharacterized protein n=1 Tax=Pseudomonas versuta TaxID=1788301 RepID=A0ABX3E651_9PSED|nr:hypothetical protein AOC04_17020 [Pseudomonas versuta]OKA18907.1 hypothetical protein BOH73_18785 [Pseudomonas versuta]